MEEKNIRLRVKELIVKSANLPQQPSEIDDHATLFDNGLNLDSIDILELVVQLEKTFGLKIRNDEQGRNILRDVESLTQAICSNTGHASSE